jgi:transmembrane sensor
VRKHFSSFEDVLSDEDFLNWYAGGKGQQASNWEAWLLQNPQYQPLVQESIQYLDMIQLKDKPVSERQVSAAHERLMKSIEETTPVIEMQGTKWRWWMSAAAILLIVTGTYFLLKKNNQLNLNTDYGQMATYKLPDGSEVMLNANSSICLNKDWKENADREVWIEGEAFFHVRKTSAKNRFVVHAKQMDIIVTGTQFNVVNREGESNVMLKEGSVTIKTKEGKTIHMTPGDYVTIANELPQKEAAPVEKVLAWTQAKLVFENTTMLAAAKMISQHYGIKVTLEKEVEEKKISGILPNDNLSVLLNALEATMDFQIVKKTNEIIISNPKQ